MVSVLVSRSTEGMILLGFSIYRIPLYPLHSLPTNKDECLHFLNLEGDKEQKSNFIWVLL